MVEIHSRYVMVFISFMAISIQYMIRLNLQVTIAAMVNLQVPVTRKTPVVTNMYPSNNTSRQKIVFRRSEPRSDWNVDWDDTEMARVLMSASFGSITTQVFAGYASERWGARYLCGIALLLTGVLSLIAPRAAIAGLEVFIIQRVAVGAVSGVIMPSVNSLVVKWLPPKERLRLSSLIFSAPNFGSMVAYAVGGLLVGHFHWAVSFYFFGSLAIIFSIPWMIFIYDSPSKHPRISQKEKLHILQGLGEKLNEEKVALPVPWGKLLTSLPMWAAILFHTGNAWVVYTLSNELPNYLITMLHMDLKKTGFMAAVPCFFALITAILCGFTSQWLRNKRLLSHLGAYRLFNGIAAIGSAATMLCIAPVGCNDTVVMVLMVVALMASNAMFGGSCVNHMDLSKNFAGTISGLLCTCISVPSILAPLTVSMLTDNDQHTFAQWNKVFCIAAGISLGTYVIYLIFGSVEEQSWNVPQQRAAIIVSETGYTDQANNNTSAEQQSTNVA